MSTSAHGRILRWTGIAVGCLVLGVILFALAFDWNSLRPALARAIADRTGRHATIDGRLSVHLLSFNPSATLEGLKIGNRSGAERPWMLDVPRLSVAVSLWRLFTGQLVLTRLDVASPKLDLEQDATGRANWEFGNAAGKSQSTAARGSLPAIQHLDVDDGSIHAALRLRKLTLDGAVSADERQGGSGGFQLRGSGSLNEKPFAIHLSGAPLLDISPNEPYDFDSHVTAGTLALDARVRIAHPFDLTALAASITLSGDDLANAFYLTGLALPNTPPYRVQASLRRNGTDYRIEHLRGRLGSSDIAGELAVDNGRVRPRLTGALVSGRLDFADLAAPLGAPVKSPAGRAAAAAPDSQARRRGGTRLPAANSIDNAPPSATAGGLLPDANLQVDRVRSMDADVTFRADAVIARKLPMKQVRMHIVLANGLLHIDPLSFVLPQGQFAGVVLIDARGTPPRSAIEMRLEDLNLAQFKGSDTQVAPLAGTLEGRVQLRGTGSSVHKFASTADGTVSFAIENGQISKTLAELTGIDVAKGLGLLLTKNQQHVDIRCGVADFQAQDGKLAVKTLVLDTPDVLITGRGDADLGSERLDFSIQGKPKKPSLVRLRTPITLHGSLEKPAVGIAADKLLAQAGEAAALGVVLTPLAAALAFVDPGLAKNADCAALDRQHL